MRRPILSIGLAAVVSLALVVALASLGWGGFFGFLQALDRPEPPLFADFVLHYYPTASVLPTTGRPTHGYFYPPSFACSIVPLTWLPPNAALAAWALVQIAAVLALMVLSGLALWRRSRGYAFGVVALSALSFPFWHSFRWGQVSVGMTALIVAALITTKRSGERSGWSPPLLLAAATAVKALPLLFVLPWLARRDGRSLGRYALATALLMVALPVLLLGPMKTWAFGEQVQQASARALATWVPHDPNSQYLPYVVARWGHQEGEPAGKREAPGLRVAGWLLFLASLGAAWRLARRDQGEELEVAALLFAALPLVLPTSWPHYFVFLPLCQVAVLARIAVLDRGALRLLSLLLVGVSMLLASLPMLAVAGGQPRYTELGLVGVANLLLLSALHLTVWRVPRVHQPFAGLPERACT